MRPTVRTPELWVIFPVLAVLVLVNLSNNLWAPDLYVPVSIAAAALLVWIARQSGLYWTDLGLGPHWVRNGFRWGLPFVGVVAIFYSAAFVIPAGQQFFVDERLAETSLWEVLWLALVRVPFGTVLLEEVAFRGVLYGLFRRRFGPLFATIGSSVLFGLWHVLPTIPLANSVPAIGDALGPGVDASLVSVLVAVAFTTVAGVGFVMLRRWSHSLLAPSLVHCATNSLGYLFAWVARV